MTAMISAVNSTCCCVCLLSKYSKQMQKQKEKQKQKPRQVEFTAEIIAAHVETKAQKRAPAEKWLQSLSS